MNKIDESKQMRSMFVDNTSFIFSSVFDLFPKVFSRNEDYAKLKNNLDNYFRFIIALNKNNEDCRMLFITSKDEKHLQQLIQSSRFSHIYNSSTFFENGDFPLLMNFWYNFAAIYMFSFLDGIDCVGSSSMYDKLPVEISRSECLAYFTSDAVSIVMGVDTISESATHGIIAYVGMLS